MKKSVRTLALVLLLLGAFSFQPAASIGESISGTFVVDVPPEVTPTPNFIFYGLSQISLIGATVNIQSNDSKWVSNGWPGVTLEKIFFSPANATTGGIFTSDVEISWVDINSGNPFPAVINSDLWDLLPAGSINTSGTLTGSWWDPETFSFLGLPVYAIVPFSDDVFVDLPIDFVPWDYSVGLYETNQDGSQNYFNRLFSLARIGTLSLDAEDPPFAFELTGGSITHGIPPVPEPTTMLLLGLGLIGLAGVKRNLR